MNKATKTLGDFIQKEIVIPCYQRGYIWGKKHTGTGKDAVTYMLESLEKDLKAMNHCLFKALRWWKKMAVTSLLTDNSG